MAAAQEEPNAAVDDDDEHDLFDEDSLYSDDDEHDEFAMMLGGDDDNDYEYGDDIESYNRMFLQQQQIRQERHQEQLLNQAKKNRKRIAEAILNGIHLKSPQHRGSNGSGSSKDCVQPTEIYSILRSPESGKAVLVPLEDRSSSFQEGEEESNCLYEIRSRQAQTGGGLANQGTFHAGLNTVGPSSA